MVSDKIGLKLHDKFTRGHVLTQAEKQKLESWYAQKDSSENEQILKTASGYSTVNSLQNAIDETHRQVASLTSRLQTVEQENRNIALENKRLREKLEKQIARQTA